MKASAQEAELLWRDLVLTATSPDGNSKALLKSLSGSVGPRSMTALMGTSGAGKTTLLNSLAGRLPPNLNLKGTILLNSHPRSRETWPELVGYVEQEFYAYEYQTVFETLLFASKIKPGDTTNQKIADRINELLAVLGLKNVKNVYIAKLSCGERKRVSIGVELLGDPPVLFCDEPTSGLDSFNALNILTLLRDLSNMGKTILVTIHQPSYEMLGFFDNMILMSMGYIVYDGDVKGCIGFFEDCGFPLPKLTNPADFFLNTISLDTRSSSGEERSLNTINHIKDEWYKKRTVPVPRLKQEVVPQINASKPSSSFFLLWIRNLSNYIRNREYLKIKLFQKVFFILVFGLAYLQIGYSAEDIYTRFGAITFIFTNVMFGVSGPVLNAFSDEKKVIYRERRSGMYSGFVAFLAKYCSEAIVDIVFEQSYVIIVYWIIGLNPDIWKFMIFLSISCSLVLFSLTYALTVGALATSAKASQVLGSTVNLILFVYSGSLNNPNTIPSWLKWIVWISPIYYAQKAAFQSQLEDVTFDDGKGGVIMGSEEILKRGLSGMDVGSCILILCGITTIWLILGATALHQNTKNNIRLESNDEEV